MIYYLKRKYDTALSSVPSRYRQFEVLNELKNGNNRRSDNLLKRTRYLFEDDNSTLDEQLNRAKDLFDKGIVQRIVYSGGKSYHCIIELDYNAIDDEEYKAIWHHLNDRFFNSKCDTQCCNANRLTRTPNAMRNDDNHVQVKQQLIADSKRIVILTTETLNLIREKIKENHQKYSHFEPKNSKIDQILNKNKCLDFVCVSSYINTPFPNITGNGGASSKGLFASVCACLKYNDTATLEKVLNKARSEHWSEDELNRVIANANKAIRS